MSKARTKILDTAEKLFYNYSFHAVGVDLIRNESGCSKTTMYAHFKSKNQLIASILERRDEYFRTSIVNYIDDPNPQVALKKIFEWHYNWFQSDDFKGCLFIRASAEFSKKDILIIDKVSQHKQWLRTLLFNYTSLIGLSVEIAENLYSILEGLTARFMVEDYNVELVAKTHKFIDQLLE